MPILRRLCGQGAVGIYGGSDGGCHSNNRLTGEAMRNPDFTEGAAALFFGDCRDILKEFPDNSVDAIVTDPPYELAFMGKKWDSSGIAFQVEVWREALRIAKPGAHILAFGSTRTHHRLMCAIEDAGWEIRDCLGWIYGSGFPKSLDVSKAIDKLLGLSDQRIITHYKGQGPRSMFDGGKPRMVSLPVSLPAIQWQGFGTGLKPAYEPIVLARKPLEGTVAHNVLKHGVGGLNIDGCRISTDDTRDRLWGRTKGNGVCYGNSKTYDCVTHEQGRFPANIIHDGSDEVMDLFPVTKSGIMKSGTKRAAQDQPGSVCYGTYGGNATNLDTFGDSGSASRFFYCAKASRSERGEGNTHPTVKPLALMRYLCRLITPPKGLILDPFCGSGSTGKAALEEGFMFFGVEKDRESFDIAANRIMESIEISRVA